MALCEACKGTGFVRREDGTVEFCKCRFNSLDENKALKIPKRFWHAELENFQPMTPSQYEAVREALNFVKIYEPEEGKGLTFVGEPGVGKTHLAVGILKEIYRTKGVRGIFFDTKDLLYRMRMLIEDRKDMKLLKAILNMKLIVLDDLGSERLSEWQREILGYIISYRYNQLKSTIITTNYRLKDSGKDNQETRINFLESRLGASIISRIYEMTRVIFMVGEDKRLPNPVKS